DELGDRHHSQIWTVHRLQLSLETVNIGIRAQADDTEVDRARGAARYHPQEIGVARHEIAVDREVRSDTGRADDLDAASVDLRSEWLTGSEFRLDAAELRARSKVEEARVRPIQEPRRFHDALGADGCGVRNDPINEKRPFLPGPGVFPLDHPGV